MKNFYGEKPMSEYWVYLNGIEVDHFFAESDEQFDEHIALSMDDYKKYAGEGEIEVEFICEY